MFQCPLPMLGISRDAPFVATIDLPDGTRLESVPAASKAQAVHNLFEGWHGIIFALPLGQHLAPLATATVTLCQVFQKLMEFDDALSALIVGHDSSRLSKAETISALHDTISQTQYVIPAAMKAHACLTSIVADNDARVMRAHPLTAYAEMMAEMAMEWSKRVLGQLGLPGAITGSYVVHFDLTPEEHICGITSGWPTEQAQRWWVDRKRRSQDYNDTLARLFQDAPQREVRIKEKFRALSEAS